MPYYFTCPLCLVKLGRGQAIKMFKKSASGSLTKRVDCGKPDFIEELLRFSGKDVYIPVGERAVYVSHDRCKAVNPFWNKASNQIVMPGSHKDGIGLLAELQCTVTYKTFQKRLYHWMVKSLRDAVELGNDYSPMWYPLQLLLATATEDGDGLKRRYGHLVEMASTKSAGKTILTLQILNQALYRNGREVTVRDFFYPNADHDDTDLLLFREKFCREMFFHSTWQDTPITRPFGTQPSAGDLRAVFIQPISSEEPPVAVTPKSPSDNKLLRLSRFVGKTVVIFLRATIFLTPKKQKPEKKEPIADLKEILEKWKRHYWNPIIFYDTAGELQQSWSPVTQAVRQLTNKLAICIDAREIFDRYEPLWPTDTVETSEGRNASIKHATQRIGEIEDAPEYKKPTCVVITKLDVVLSPTEREQVKLIAEDPDGDEAALLLLKWLTDHADHDKKTLRSKLMRRPALVDRVFFVWTENLPRMSGVRISPIKQIQPTMAKPGEEVTLEANDEFNFNDAQKITFNGVDSKFEVKSKSVIKAVVPEGATSGLVGILLKGQIAEAVGQTSTTYTDDATSDIAFTVKPEQNSDASKPRSYGLIKFLAWCLDKKVDEISRQTGD